MLQDELELSRQQVLDLITFTVVYTILIYTGYNIWHKTNKFDREGENHIDRRATTTILCQYRRQGIYYAIINCSSQNEL